MERWHHWHYRTWQFCFVLPINGQTETFNSVCNIIVLCKRSFGLTPFFWIESSNILFNFINETFFIPPNDGVRRPCRGIRSIYNLNILIIYYDCINCYYDFNLLTSMSENIHSICLVVYYSIISHGDMFSCFKWHSYSWGVVIMVFLYKYLCLTCMKEVKQVGGCLLFL